MSHGLKLLLIAAGAIITCIVVVVGFQLTKSGKNDTNAAKEQYTHISSEYDDVALSAYDGVTLTGSDVVDCIEKNGALLVSEGNFTITVITAENIENAAKGTEPEGCMYQKDYADKLDTNTATKASTSDNYINPLGKFKGEISRNDNGIIENITFTQEL